MGFWDTVGRVGLDAATLGGAEIPGFKNLMVGGDLTNSIDAQPKQYDYATGQLGQIANSAGNRAAPTIQGTQLDPTQMAQSRAGSYSVANRLGAIAGGQQMGAGELAVNHQLGQAVAQQVAQARMARGVNGALAARNAARNSADVGMQAAGIAAQSRMTDQANANQQLAGIYGNLYGQDASVAAQNAQLGQSAQVANQNAQLAQTQMNDYMRIQALGQMLGWDQTRIAAEMQKAGIALGDKGILPSLLQVGGAAAAAGATGGASTIGSAAAGGGGGGGGGQSLASMYPHGGGGGPITTPY
jgi:hypothetical protein